VSAVAPRSVDADNLRSLATVRIEDRRSASVV
jgi:hypothetical protein